MESSNDLIANNKECVPIPIGHTITNEGIDSLCGKSLLLPSCFPHHRYAQKTTTPPLGPSGKKVSQDQK
jgi:hypothetical protein